MNIIKFIIKAVVSIYVLAGMSIYVTAAGFLLGGAISFLVLFASALASTRGRNPWWWVILSVTISPIITIILLFILKDLSNAQVENTQKDSSLSESVDTLDVKSCTNIQTKSDDLFYDLILLSKTI